MRYTLGLDLGIASIGWAVRNLDNPRIEDLGVRVFEKGETTKGEPLNAERRGARSSRRTIRRRAKRMVLVKDLFIRYGLVSEDEMQNLYKSKKGASDNLKPWRLRNEALERILNGKELAIVLTHLAKRRGYRSNSKQILIDENKKKEDGKVTVAIKDNDNIMKINNYETIGQMFYVDDKFSRQKRNKVNSYVSSVTRGHVESEIKVIFKRQRALGNKLASEVFEKQYLQVVLFQLDYTSEALAFKRLGKCTFEKDECRAYKNTFSFERFTLLTSIYNLRIRNSGRIRILNCSEREQIIKLAYLKPVVTFRDIRKQLELEENDKFEGLTYSKKRDVESSKSIELKGYHSLKGIIQEKEFLSNFKLMDELVTIIAMCNEKELLIKLQSFPFDDEMKNKLMNISFSGVGHLSLKAINNILRILELAIYQENGITYDKACLEAGYNFNKPINLVKQKLLPKITDDIRNPIVLRTMTQCRKVVNEIIRRHGSPTSVHIELARELAKSFEERKLIEKEQKLNRENRERILEDIKQSRHIENISARLLEKYILAEEQDFKCPYSSLPIDINELINDDNYCQVDHIIPFSRSFDDSRSNKVVVLTAENQRKGNRIPYEYFKDYKNNEQWEQFKLNMSKNTRFSHIKKENFLRITYTKEDMDEFKDRNLNDTKSITKKVRSYIENNLALNEDKDIKPIVAVHGRLTDLMRKRWGLNKVREKNDLHHAMDAAVIACIDTEIINRIAQYSKNKELKYVGKGYIDVETGEVFDIKRQETLFEKFPVPWSEFRDEIEARLSRNPRDVIEQKRLANYDMKFLDKVNNPIIVSRTPKKRASGEIHKATIESASKHINDKIQVEIPLKYITLKNLENMVDKDNKFDLYKLIQDILLKYNDNAANAFAEPIVYIPKGKKKEVKVGSIKVFFDSLNKMNVRNGITDLGQCIRDDVFEKCGSYFFRRVYFKDIALNKLSDIAKGSSYVYLDDSYKFCCSLFKNDLIKIEHKDGNFFGYIAHIETDGRIKLINVDGSEYKDRVNFSKIKKLTKYNVGVLGDYHIVNENKINSNYKNRKEIKKIIGL
jgi:CRISPR-associated endonuclease Csn1